MILLKQRARATAMVAERRGTALALALVVVSAVAMLGAGFLQMSSMLVARQALQVDQQRAFYLAEAGLAESFQAVRMGRTGQVGSEDAPASFGQGIVWVDVVEMDGGSLRLDSTAMCGVGRSRLSLVVEPVDLSLGFFADEDLVLDSVVLVDGWDSDQATYAASVGDHLPSREELETYAIWLQGMIGSGRFKEVVVAGGSDGDIDPTVEYSGTLQNLSRAELEVLARMQPALRLGYPKGWSKEGPDPAYGQSEPLQSSRIADDSDPATTAPASGALTSTLGVTTGTGARLGSNSSVHFTLPPEETAEIWGDVQHGPLGAVTGLDNVTIAGSVEGRSSTIELPEIVLPSASQAAPVRHDDLLPLLISPGTSGYESVEIAAGAELVIRGPATVVIDTLVLEPTALLTLDTRGGEVVLFVTGQLDLQAGSLVECSGERPDETTVQVSSTTGDLLNPAVRLDGTSQFYGTVYAPKADVHIGSEFEVFGGVVARRLDVSAGARLHFDNSGFAGSALPRIVGWRVVEVPPNIRQLRGDPFQALGLDRSTLATLSDAHDLGAVDMDLVYLDHASIERAYSGPEDLFDWAQATEVVSVERQPEREHEAGPAGADDSGDSAPTTDTRAEIEQLIAELAGRTLKDELEKHIPLSADELVAMLDSQKMGRDDSKDLLLNSLPLDDAPLTKILNMESTLGNREAVEVFIAASPLSPEMFDAVMANSSGFFGGADLSAIRDAQ